MDALDLKALRSPGRAYTLVFGDAEVARVVEEDCELLSITGSYALLEPAREDPSLRDLVDLHDLSVEKARLEGLGRLADRDPDQDPRFQPLLQSKEWALRNANGDRRPIAPPRFLTGGKIVWGWR